MKKILFIAISLIFLASCDSKPEMKDLAQENLKASLDYPAQLKVQAISEPDSAFGVSYFTRNEMTGMLRVMSKVTSQLMKKTSSVDDFSKVDAYTASLARRQMAAASEVQNMIFKNVPKGEWSGWKVKIDYQCVDRNAIPYRAERWVFLDKKGENVIKTFEIPLP